MKPIIQFVLDIFRFHKKKIAFFFAAIAFWLLVLFPYDDLSDLVTLKVAQATQSNVYLQFDGLSLGFLPQMGVKMENVLVESIYAPTLSLKTLGFAPKLSNLFGSPGGKVKAYGLFGGDAIVDIGSSSELNVEGQEFGVTINLEKVALKDLSKFLKKSYNLPVTMSGQTFFDSKMYIDPNFKQQPKGDVELRINKLEIPSSNISLGAGGLSMPFPALQLSNVVIQGSINDGKFFIKEGKIGDAEKKDNLYGQITGDIFFEVQRGGKIKMGGYDLKLNLNIKENLKRQLGTILGFIDFYEGIGSKYKFDTLGAVRYSMRLTARDMKTSPRISSF